MLYILFAAVIAVGDQLFKGWIVNNIELSGYMQVLPGVFHLTYIRNTGAAFSMFEGMRWVLAAVSVAASAVIVVYLFKSRIGVVGKISAAAVLGGAIGNLIDRIWLGYVVDMFEVEFMEYAVFNIADCFIVVGGILFIICYIIFSIREEQYDKALGRKKMELKRMPELDRLKSTAPEPVGERIITDNAEESEGDEPEDSEEAEEAERADGEAEEQAAPEADEPDKVKNDD